MSKTSVARPARKYSEAERGRMVRVLRESLERYEHELMDIEEREMLCDRIIRLKVELARSAS